MTISKNSSYQDVLAFSAKGLDYLRKNHEKYAFEQFGDRGNSCYKPYKDDDLEIVNMLIGAIRTKMPKKGNLHKDLSECVAADINNTWISYDWLCKACARLLQTMDF